MNMHVFVECLRDRGLWLSFGAFEPHFSWGRGGSGFVYLCTRLDKHQLLNIYSAGCFAEHKSVRVRGHWPFCFEVVLKKI